MTARSGVAGPAGVAGLALLLSAAMQAATLDVYRELARDPRREPP